MIATTQTLHFRELTPRDADWAVPYMEKTASQSCDACFATLYLWRHHYGNRIAQTTEGIPLFCFGRGENISYLQPEGEALPELVTLLREQAHRAGRPLSLYGGSKASMQQMEHCFPGVFEICELPADGDYLYRREDLADLSGRAYAAKRNHIASFSRRCDWSYESLGADNAADFQETARLWLQQREDASEELEAECRALTDVLAHREPLRVRGGLIRVAGQPVAVTLGAPINRDTFDIQIEKALPDYAEAYAVINREFVRHELTDFLWINRENDAGIEGLRRAKLSYHPAGIWKKYFCTERM